VMVCGSCSIVRVAVIVKVDWFGVD